MKMVFSKYLDYKMSKTTHLKSLYFGKSTLNELSSYILVLVKLTNTYIKTKHINTLLILKDAEYSLQLLILLIHTVTGTSLITLILED